MSRRVTLGGERLGSGKKMKVELHGYERSTHDLGYIWRSTMSAGTLVPFMSKVALPGDTFDINLDCDIKTHPTIGPLFGSYKVQLDVFQIPIRLYNSLLHNNALNIGLTMDKVKFPTYELIGLDYTGDADDIDNSQVNPSCILSYLGVRGVGYIEGGEGQQREFNAIPLLAYWDIYKNYYANKQEEIGAVIHTAQVANTETITLISVFDQWGGSETLAEDPATASVALDGTRWFKVDYTGAVPKLNEVFIKTSLGTYSLNQMAADVSDFGTHLQVVYNNVYGSLYIENWRYATASDVGNVPPKVVTFPLENIDTMKKRILAYSSETTPYLISTAPELPPYVYPIGYPAGKPNALFSQEGLGLKTYQSDLFNNWIQTEWIDGTNGINAITAIDTSGGEFTLDTLNLANKVYKMLTRIAVSGGSYDDWVGAVYDHDPYTRAYSPMYCGGLIKELVFQEVVSNAESADQALGTLAGRGVMSKKHKGGSITVKVDEPSYIMGIISLTPRVDYSQGNEWDVHLKTMDDLHKPGLDEIGFQDLITEQMAWWDTTWDTVTSKWVQKSAGKQPAWINYMTSTNKVLGNFAIPDNEMFMTLNRRYEKNFTVGQGIKDLTTYIDPSKFNHIFAETSLDAQNFWAQIAVDITARRKMSAKVMPNL